MTDSVTRTRPRLSLRTRIGLLTALAVAIAITLTTIAVYVIVRKELYHQFDSDLLRRTEAVAQAVGNPQAVAQFPAALADNAYVGLLRPDNVMFPSQGGVAPPSSAAELAVAEGNAEQSIRAVTQDGESLRVAAVPAGTSGALVLAQPTAPVDKTLSDLTAYLIVIGLLGVAGAGMLGYAVARTGLRPVADLTAATERVALTKDLTPIDVTGDDEVSRLAESFNAMLTSLDAARERERRLVADAGHELRTPLTSVRTNLDLLAQANAAGVELPDGERTALLDDVREQISELSDLVGDLVQLSRGAPDDTPLEYVNLVSIVNRATDRVRRRAPNLSFVGDLQPWWLNGDAALLERAVTNLLDNAAKWSPADGTVSLRLDGGRLSVCDEGPGIPEGEQTQVFERFYRSSAARGTPGSGLGLAIVAMAAERHGGTVEARSRAQGGAELILTLPGSGVPVAAD